MLREYERGYEACARDVQTRIDNIAKQAEKCETQEDLLHVINQFIDMSHELNLEVADMKGMN